MNKKVTDKTKARIKNIVLIIALYSIFYFFFFEYFDVYDDVAWYYSLAATILTLYLYGEHKKT